MWGIFKIFNRFVDPAARCKHEPDTSWDLYKKTYVEQDWKGNIGKFFLEQCKKCGVTYLPK